MRRIYTEVRIAAPPAAVWQLLTDLKNYENWNPFIVKAEGTIQEGRSFRGYVRMLPGRFEWHSKYRLKTLRLKPEREWSWLGRFLNIPWLIDGEQCFRLVAEDGGTRLMQTQHFTGILLPFCWRLFTSHQVMHGTQKMFAAIKNTAESASTASPETPAPLSLSREDPCALQRLKGSWALVTGASSGIGQEFSRQLAQAGLNIVSVARRKDVLDDWGDQLRRDYHVETRTVAVDLTASGSAEHIHAALRAQGIRIRMLCNIAGVDAWGYFEDTSLPAYRAMMRLNAEIPVELCHLFRDDLASHLTSAVINVSCRIGFNPLPYLAVSSATKAFVLNFSRALYGEWIWQGTLVQTLLANPTATNLSSLKLLRAEGFFRKLEAPAQVVRRSLEHLACGAPLVETKRRSLPHRIFAALVPARTVLLTLAQRFRPPRTGSLTPDGVPPEGKPVPGIASVCCPVCGHVATPPDARDLGTAQGNTERFRETTFKLWKCPRCLSIQALDPADLGDIYSDYPLNHRRVDLFARRTYGNLLRRLKRLGLRKTDAILDYGCGDGVFIEVMKQEGYRVVGYDPYVPAFAKPPERDQRFDWVIANDVIEHVTDPRALMHEVYDRVKPGGLLYVGTCDAAPVDINDLEAEITRLHQPFHRVLLSEESLRRLALETGGKLIAAYRRSYLDTLTPMANYRFLDEACRAFGRSMDDALDPWSQRLLYLNPKLWFYGFFGYFFPSANEPALIVRKEAA